MLKTIKGKNSLRFAKFLVETFANKPDDMEGLDFKFSYQNKKYKFLIKEYQEEKKT